MVLLDGIDEVPENKNLGDGKVLSQEKAQEWIIGQKKSILKNNSLARIIMTSRPNRSERFKRDFEFFGVQKLEFLEIECFTQIWYAEYKRQLKIEINQSVSGKNSIETKLSCL